MSIIDEKTRRCAANSIFPSFFYAIFGLVLAQVGAAQVHGSWGLHVFLGVPGLTLSGLALFRARRHWPATAAMPSLRAHVFGWLLLLMVGAVIGVLACAGSVLLLSIVAALTYVVPWSKIPVCRARFVPSSMAFLAGAVASVALVVLGGRAIDPIHTMIAAWMLFAPPMSFHILILVSLDADYRIHAPRLADKPEVDMRAPFPQ